MKYFRTASHRARFVLSFLFRGRGRLHLTDTQRRQLAYEIERIITHTRDAPDCRRYGDRLLRQLVALTDLTPPPEVRDAALTAACLVRAVHLARATFAPAALDAFACPLVLWRLAVLTLVDAESFSVRQLLEGSSSATPKEEARRDDDPRDVVHEKLVRLRYVFAEQTAIVQALDTLMVDLDTSRVIAQYRLAREVLVATAPPDLPTVQDHY